MAKKEYTHWTCEETLLWLEEEFKLPMYKELFGINTMSVNGEMLSELTDMVLEKDFGITVKLHRNKIILGRDNLEESALALKPQSSVESLQA